MRLKATFLTFCAAAAFCGAPAWANAPQNITAGELARLPEYCPDAQLFETRGMPDAPTPRQRRWVGLMGSGFWAVHHYCWAVLYLHRSDYPGVTPQQREHMLRTAISDSVYVLNNSQPGFPLLPEILTRIGQFNQRLGLPIQALEHFDKAREVKPDYWPAYVGLAEVNQSIGKRQAAIDVLNEGLKLMPAEPRLVAALEQMQSTAGAPRGTRPAASKGSTATTAGNSTAAKP